MDTWWNSSFGVIYFSERLRKRNHEPWWSTSRVGKPSVFDSLVHGRCLKRSNRMPAWCCSTSFMNFKTAMNEHSMESGSERLFLFRRLQLLKATLCSVCKFVVNSVKVSVFPQCHLGFNLISSGFFLPPHLHIYRTWKINTQLALSAQMYSET